MADKPADQTLEEILNDSATAPPASAPVTESDRVKPDAAGDPEPKGTPSSHRHATETATGHPHGHDASK